MSPTAVAVAGSTGSIGTQALEVIAANPDRFRLHAIGARSSVDTLVTQAQLHHPDIVAIADSSRVAELQERLPTGIELRSGPQALASMAQEADTVLNSVVGFAGLGVTLETLNRAKRLALANKESLIAAGPLVHEALKTPGAELVPVDSEHGALHQCLRSGRHSEVNRMVLTASGGPFRGWTRHQLEQVRVADALKHPTWSMGPKITVDSSTLFNKGLEIIEAHLLFGIDYDCIEAVVHPQSVVHSMVEFCDGSSIAQLSNPDMRLAIGYALGHPDRLPTAYGAIDWTKGATLTFEAVDVENFGCLALAFEAGRSGGTAPTWLNAANEVAVAAFLSERIAWLEISDVVRATLDRWDGAKVSTVADIDAADSAARQWAEKELEHKG